MRNALDLLALTRELEALWSFEAVGDVKSHGEGAKDVLDRLVEKNELEQGIASHLFADFERVVYPPENALLNTNCNVVKKFVVEARKAQQESRQRVSALDSTLFQKARGEVLSEALALHNDGLRRLRDEYLL